MNHDRIIILNKRHKEIDIKPRLFFNYKETKRLFFYFYLGQQGLLWGPKGHQLPFKPFLTVFVKSNTFEIMRRNCLMSTFYMLFGIVGTPDCRSVQELLQIIACTTWF